ncbi:response regulator transcription factor [Dactylosporangium sucinum]|uniref:Uncharacterized protein n=1 Tax=Dactylosporangium sucinum TaxID=1424081 RepID=A0A917U9U6_9ACTN|nr:response regulator transcription factor [Dactylosporangium sucinum]GGM65459.1 hypothetical protein GCM10007977_078750 [Dactylosporangium sucinum]
MNIATLPRRTAFRFDRVTVLLVAGTSRLSDLPRHLPGDWLVVQRPQLADGDVRDPDIVVLDDPGPRAVSAACLRHPAAAVVAVLSQYSDHQDVVDVLEAGADACVRAATTAIVAAHVEACQRRLAA